MQASVLAVGIILVLAFDVVASIASKSFGFPYVRATIGSYVIYFFVGALAAASAISDPVIVAAATAGTVGVVDASLGWWLSWQIGPGRPASDFVLTPKRWMTVAVTVATLAAVVGAIGGLVERTFQAGATAI